MVGGGGDFRWDPSAAAQSQIGPSPLFRWVAAERTMTDVEHGIERARA